MTISECQKYLPQSWTEIIEQDQVLLDIFEEHEYDLEQEAVPPFLFQDLRGGDLERLSPIFALYGQSGQHMLQGLLEIDEASRDTAKVQLPNGQTGYAAYFFAQFSDENKQAAMDAARAYIRDINRIFVEEFEEDAPLEEDAEIEFLFGQEGRDFEEKVRQAWIHGDLGEDVPDIDMGEWCLDLPYRKGCQDIGLMSEALYHISCDYNLSYYLQWPMFDTEQENPFQGYFDLWKLGLNIHFPEKNRVVLVGE
ncbi:MAG: hypothetical protein HFI32_04740 [Lachnospiraceae bacterium]|nr:hypothetical protein [Lachnospiraceae bacterium]